MNALAKSLVALALTNKTEYDLYFNALTDVAALFALLAGVFPFWAMRAQHKKHDSIKCDNLIVTKYILTINHSILINYS